MVQLLNYLGAKCITLLSAAASRVCSPKELDAWAQRLRTWASGQMPDDLPRVDRAHEPKKITPRDVFAYVIHEGKIRAPAAAMALIERLKIAE